MSTVVCPYCQAKIQSNQASARRTKCPGCSNVIAIPPEINPVATVSRNRKLPIGFLVCLGAASAIAVGLVGFIAGRSSSGQSKVVKEPVAAAVAERPVRKKPMPNQRENPQDNLVKAKPGMFGALPKGIDAKHAQVIRDYLKDNLPLGKWEEIEWNAIPIAEGEPNNAVEAIADRDNKGNGQPAGVQTMLKLRAVNDSGNKQVVTVGVRQRGDIWKFMNLENDYFVWFDTKDGPQ